jgi:hypothetical protein
MESMTEDPTPRKLALEHIAESISKHQPYRPEGSLIPACSNSQCKGLSFPSIRAQYEHQATALVNDLQHDLLLLEPAPAPERPRRGADPRLGPAVEAFRHALARQGSLSSISYIEDAMASALQAADLAVAS